MGVEEAYAKWIEHAKSGFLYEAFKAGWEACLEEERRCKKEIKDYMENTTGEY